MTGAESFSVLQPFNGGETLARIEDALRTRYWSWVFRDPSETPSSLLVLLMNTLPHIDSTSWPERFEFGGIFINGYEALTDSPLPCPCKIEYYEPKFEIRRATEIFPSFHSNYVIYRDEDLAVVFKPPGLSSMPAKEQRHFSLKNSVEKLIGVTVHMPSRLDVSVEGLVMISISARMHPLLQKLFESREVTKIYRLATHRLEQREAWVDDGAIDRDELHPVLRKVSVCGGQKARTEFRRIGTVSRADQDLAIFEARPITGRTHQIRVHAANSKIPIVGDRFYGGIHAATLHLVSHEVRLTHPISRRPLEVTLPPLLTPSYASLTY